MLALICAGIGACEESGELGEEFIVKEPLNLYYMDTVSLQLSTVIFDSLPTSTTEELLVGYHEDGAFGKITASAFFQLDLASISTYPGSRAAYEGLSLRMYYDGYSYYDTTQTITLDVYQLAEAPAMHSDGYLYNTSSFQPQMDLADTSTTVGSLSFSPQPNQKAYVDIPLDGWLGEELFGLLQSKDDTIQTEAAFLEKYKGFLLSPGQQTSGPFVRFTTASTLRLTYKEDGEVVELLFPIDESLHFSQISSNREGGPLAGLQQQKEALAASETANTAYLQGGVGLGIRVDFPYLQKLNELQTNDVLSQAYLRLSIPRGTYSNSMPLPETLTVYVVDGLNRITGEYATSMVKVEDKEFGDDTYYSILITDFIKSQKALEGENENALLLTLPTTSLYSTVNHLEAGNQQHQHKSILDLYLLDYETNN